MASREGPGQESLMHRARRQLCRQLGVLRDWGTLGATLALSGCQGASGDSNETTSGSAGSDVASAAGSGNESRNLVPTDSEDSTRPGLWSGTTSDGTAISFTVTNYGGLTDLRLEYPACGGIATIAYEGPISVTGDEFINSSGDVQIPGDALGVAAGAEGLLGPTVTSHSESGLFDSPSSAHGDYLVEGTSVGVSTTSYDYSSSGESIGSSTDSATCSAAGAGTWTATWSAPLPETAATTQTEMLYGDRIDGQYYLGTIGFAEISACASDGYPEELRNATGLDGEFLVSVDSEHADGGSICDACVQITTETGRSIVARVITYGFSIAPGDLDVSSSVYSELYSGEYPRAMSWQLASCPDTGPLSYQFSTIAHAWYMRLWVRNPRVPISEVAVRSAEHPDFTPLQRGEDGAFVDDAGFGEGEFTLRVTGINGEVMLDTFPGFTPGEVVVSTQQFE